MIRPFSIRYALLCLNILSASGLYAQYDDYTTYRYRIQASYVYSMPLGQFSTHGNNIFFIGQCLPASGIGCLFDMKLFRQCHIGLQIDDAKYNVSQSGLYTSLRQHYGKQGFFTTISSSIPYVDLVSVGGVVAYSLQYRFAEIEPWVSVGACFLSLSNDNIAAIHRKERNDNYSEDIVVQVNGANSAILYPGIGVRANKKIYGVLYGSLSLGYYYGVARYTLVDQTTDFLYNAGTSTRPVSQAVTALQVEAGIQLRFHKWLR